MICYLLLDEQDKAEEEHANYLKTKKSYTTNHERLDEILFHLDKGDDFKNLLEEKGGPFFMYEKPDWAK